MDQGNNGLKVTNVSVRENSQRESIMESRLKAKEQVEDLAYNFSNQTKDLDNLIRKMKDADLAGTKFSESLEDAKAKITDLTKTGTVDFENMTKAQEESLKAQLKALKEYYKKKRELAKDDEKEVKRLREMEAESVREISDELSELRSTIDSVKNASSKSLYDAVHNNIKELKSNLKDIAVVSGLDNIYSQISGKSGQVASYNTMRSQFAMTRSDFDKFKRDIASTVMENGNITKYGFQDALDYMNRLGELGITDQEIAKEQLDAIMLSTKYLGMSADTQAKILKQARNTGNMDLLNQTNQTMVQIMNAQLGIAKDQLDAIVNQSTELADLSVMFSGNTGALQSFTQSGSAIESVYGEAAAKATMTIASELLNNGNNASNYAAILGEEYGSIMQGLQSGDGRALYQILQAVQSSSVAKAGSYNPTMYGSLTNAGLLNKDTTALFNARAASGKSYDTAMESIASSSGDTKKYLEDMQQDFKSMLENVTSWVGAWLPLGSLQTIFYGLAIADIAFGVGRNLFQIKALMTKQMIPGLKDLISGNKESLEILGNTGAGKTAGILGNIGAIAGTLSIIAGVVWGIGDAIKAQEKAEDWGVSNGSAAVGGFLGGNGENVGSRTGGNALKFGLIGAGIGTLIAPGVGTAIGAAIGAVLGSVLGLIGGKNIATFTDSLTGGGFGAPAGIGSTGTGAAMTGGFPWGISSPFGYRGTIQTAAGPTNPFHDGIDLTNGEGTPIGANNSGIVSASGTAGDGANYVIINSGDGYEQLYWHLMQPSSLRKGQRVNAGQLIGYMGMTGMATGPHLHFGLRHAGTKNYIDPMNYINSTLFNPSATGIPDLSVYDEETPSTQILRKMIDADTTSNKAYMADYGVGSAEVVSSVNNGFTSLIDKIDELSSRQNQQEDMLRMLAQGKGTNVYKY